MKMHLNVEVSLPTQEPMKVTSRDIGSANTTNTTTNVQINVANSSTSLKQIEINIDSICLYLNDISKNPTAEVIEQVQLPSNLVERKNLHNNNNNKSKLSKLLPSVCRKHKLQAKIPELLHFNIHRKIGCGTFSSVYLATLKSNSARQYAIKHHIPTASPTRIEWEYKCLQTIGGIDNVCGIKAAFRHNDCTVFVMPYLPHVRFSDYILEMGVAETRGYIRGLLTALARVHSFNIIHRDVKPSNFLYNRKTRECLLVDFGLACESFQSSNQSSATPLVMEYNKRKRYALSDDIHSGNPPKRRALQTRLNDNIIVPNPSSVLNGSARKRRKAENRPPPSERLSNGVCKNLFTSNVRPETTDNRCVDVYLLAQTSQQTQTHLNGHSELKPSIESSTPNVNKEKGSLMAPRNKTNANSKKSGHTTNGIKTSKQLVGLFTEEKVKNGEASTSRAQHSVTFQTLTPSHKNGVSFVRVQNSQVKSVHSKSTRKDLFALPAVAPQCTCFGKSRVCSVCSTRRVKMAPRAGTPGFRPPEVLFKYSYQTTAVDMWAAGVVMLCIMSGSYPFFKSPDDLSALSEITMLFGSDKVKEMARKLGRHVQFSDVKMPLNIRKLCETLRHRKQHAARNDSTTSQTSALLNDVSKAVCNVAPQCPNCMQSKDPVNGCLCAQDVALYPVAEPTQQDDNVFPAAAYDLLTKLMDLNPQTRISAADALKHPFLSE